MMLEADEGEKELASKPKQGEDLLKMLGLAPHIKSKAVPQPDAPQTEEKASEGKITQQSQADEITKGVRQGLPPNAVPVEEASSTIQPVSNDHFVETMDRAKEGREAEETPSEAPPKPLKKPKAASVRPFRRKATRDRTGGFRRNNKEKD